MVELWSFEDFVSRCGFSESGNTSLVFVLTAQFGKYMAIVDECGRIEQSVDQNMKNLRNNWKRDLIILIFYTKVTELAEIAVRKTDWNGVNLFSEVS